jgi:hypothetical protein
LDSPASCPQGQEVSYPALGGKPVGLEVPFITHVGDRPAASAGRLTTT